MNRRVFVRTGGVLAYTVLAGSVACERRSHRTSRGLHPDARVGIDASRVLTADELVQFPKAAPVFAMVREMPAIMDSVRCHCNCAVTQRKRSLLECFEADGMAKDCDLCLEEAARVYGLQKAGMDLERIRKIIDSAFG